VSFMFPKRISNRTSKRLIGICATLHADLKSLLITEDCKHKTTYLNKQWIILSILIEQSKISCEESCSHFYKFALFSCNFSGVNPMKLWLVSTISCCSTSLARSLTAGCGLWAAHCRVWVGVCRYVALCGHGGQWSRLWPIGCAVLGAGAERNI
jgi:hypothetical protein